MKARVYTKDDHAELARWWTHHNWPVVTDELLYGSTGFIVENEGRMICAGFYYPSLGHWGWLEYVVTNPDSGLKERAKAVDVLLERLKDFGQALGQKIFIATLKSTGLMKAYQKHGFVKGDSGMTNMIARVN